MKRLFVLAYLLGAGIATAQPLPSSGSEIRSLVYLPNQVVRLNVAIGYAVLVELSPDERIDNVVVGDSSAWQVTTTRQGNQIVVKPISAATTDLIVSTTSRRYVFLLQAGEAGSGGPFVLRFDYPTAFPPLAAASTPVTTYRLHGDAALFPLEMSGSGGQTSIVWKAGTALPAVFALGGDGHEALVNGRMEDGTYVIEGNAERYIFRRDKAKAVADRDKIRGTRR